LEELGRHLPLFRIPFVDVRRLIESTPEFWKYPMCDRDPPARWSHGRVTLLGDGGASDVSGRLQRRLAGDPRCPGRWPTGWRPPRPLAALWAYEQERLPMTAQIVRMNRTGGRKASSMR